MALKVLGLLAALIALANAVKVKFIRILFKLFDLKLN